MNMVSIAPSNSWPPRGFFNLFPKQEGEKVTLHENRNTYLVVAVFPGFIKDDIRIHFRNGILSIHASSYTVSGSRNMPLYAKRHIHRTVRLSGDVDEEQIRYLYERNELRIWVPKKHKKKHVAASRTFEIIRKLSLFRRLRAKF